MKRLLTALYWFFAQLGGFGLLGLAILDSSILFMPLGNDLLIVALSANNAKLLPYYAAMATAGSLIGVLITDTISRKGGEAGLEKTLPPKRLEYIKGKVTRRAGWALALASVMPPPFPFTPFVAGAAALQYPRRKLLAVVGAARFSRFILIGLLAVFYGKRILEMAKRPEVQGVVLALVAMSAAGSIISVVRWFRRSRERHRTDAAPHGRTSEAEGRLQPE